MYKLVWGLFVGSALLTSCAHDELTTVKKIDGYDPRFMFYPSNPFPVEHNIIKLQYDSDGRVTKRSGGFVAWRTGYGIFYVFDEGLYEEVTYGKHVVTLQRKYGPSGADLDYKKEIFLKDGQASRIVLTSNRSTLTTYLVYNSAGRIIKTVDSKWHTGLDTVFMSMTTRSFFYSGANLIKIEGQESDRLNNKTTTLELFEDYDSAPNPTRPLMIFDEIFYRSLSYNNFSKYSFEKRDSSGSVVARSNRSWVFAYDDLGVPIL